MKKSSKIFVAGHRGLVGSAIVKELQSKGYENLLLKTRQEVDLCNPTQVETLFKEEKPDHVFLAAAKVGGISANNAFRADFIYQNLQIQNNVIHQSFLNGVSKLLFLGSTCIYPKEAPQPMAEDCLLTSSLEYTNEPYAIAKIAGVKMCESYNLQYGTNFISVMPTNLYGPGDNFDLESSHVLPALIRKFHLAKLLSQGKMDEVLANLNIDNETEARKLLEIFGVSEKVVEVWGTGNPKREFLWSEDMADACVFLMENTNFKDLIKDSNSEVKNTHINIGTGKEVSIKDLAILIKDTIGFRGEIVFNSERPDGTMRKLTSVKKINDLGWRHKVELAEGVKRIYEWYLAA